MHSDFFVLYIDEVILQRTIATATEYYFTHDYRYSVTSLTNTAGSIVESYDYKVYGERTASGSVLTDVGYTGQRHDSETGLMYFKNRYYSVERGSFVTMDPLGFVDGMSRSLGYFGGQGRDPFGLDVKSVKPKIKLIVSPSAFRDSLKVDSDDPTSPKVTYDSEVEAYNKNIDKLVEYVKKLKKQSDAATLKKTKFKFDGVEIEADQFVIKLQELKIELIKLKGSTNDEIIKDLARAYLGSSADDIILFHTHTHVSSLSQYDIMLLDNQDDSDAIPFKDFNEKLNKNIKELMKEQKIEKMTKTASFTFNTCLMTSDEAKDLFNTLSSKEVRFSKTAVQPAFPSFSYTKDGKELTKEEKVKEKGFFSLYFNIDGSKIKLNVVK